MDGTEKRAQNQQISVAELGLSARAYNALRLNKISRLSQIAALTVDQLLQLDYITRPVAEEIFVACADLAQELLEQQTEETEIGTVAEARQAAAQAEPGQEEPAETAEELDETPAPAEEAERPALGERSAPALEQLPLDADAIGDFFARGAGPDRSAGAQHESL